MNENPARCRILQIIEYRKVLSTRGEVISITASLTDVEDSDDTEIYRLIFSPEHAIREGILRQFYPILERQTRDALGAVSWDTIYESNTSWRNDIVREMMSRVITDQLTIS